MRLPAWDAAHHEVLAHLHRAAGDDRLAEVELALAAEGFASAGQPLDEERCRALWREAAAMSSRERESGSVTNR